LLEIRWPDGDGEKRQDIPAGDRLVVEQRRP
jgi:hypothetical protein